MKTVLITGAGRGLGQALTKTFEKEGYRLILNSRTPFNYISGYNMCRIIIGDIQLYPVIIQLEDAVLEFGGLDVLINNAGIYQKTLLKDTTFDEYRTMIDTNLLSPIRLIQTMWSIFTRQESGLIVNINSKVGQRGSNGESAYCTSKFGLRGFSQSIQKDASRIGVKVLDVFLGAIKTDMTKGREDWEKLIDPFDAADIIFNMCKYYKSLRISEITINRGIY